MNEVPDLEYCIILAQAKLPQKGYSNYRLTEGKKSAGLYRATQVDWLAVKHKIYKAYAAPTTQELLDKLSGIYLYKGNTEYEAWQDREDIEPVHYKDANPANALAKLTIDILINRMASKGALK